MALSITKKPTRRFSCTSVINAASRAASASTVSTSTTGRGADAIAFTVSAIAGGMESVLGRAEIRSASRSPSPEPDASSTVNWLTPDSRMPRKLR